MNRTTLIHVLCFVLAMQVLFTSLCYFGGYALSPTLLGGITAGVVSMHFVRQRRRAN